MCGVVGLITVSGPQRARHEFSQTLTQATNAIRSRGPDDEGQWISEDGKVGLGHRRLSILDLSARGHQPMCTERGSVLTYNGEIYNFKELRQQLTQSEFTSGTDSEVLLHGLEKYGTTWLEKLDGMFAFGFYSPAQSRLLLATDPAGKKPIYTYWDGQTFAFASEIKALREISGLRWNLDHFRLKQSLVYGYVPSPYTIYANVRKVPAGHFQTVDLTSGPQSVKVYWDVPLGGAKTERNYKSSKEELRHLLSAAVGKRLVADVPVGCFLSGGLDSSAIAFEAARLCQENTLRTFSAGFAQDPMSAHYDETVYARKVAANIRSKHIELQMRGGAIDASEIMARFDEPFGDSSAIPTYLLCAETSKHVKVVLSGDGGDEIFGGYLRFRAALAAEKYQTLLQIALSPLRTVTPSPHTFLSRLKRMQGAISSPLIKRLAVWNSFFSESDFQNFLGESEEDLFSSLRTWDEKTAGLSIGTKILYYNFKTYLFDDLLPKVDRMSMSHGLEVRSPFLDKKLIEFAFALPDHFKFDVFRTKKILKDAYRGDLGSEITDRAKHGFAFPLETFLESTSQSHTELAKVFPTAAFDWKTVAPLNRKSKEFMLWSLEVCLQQINISNVANTFLPGHK